MLSNENRKIHDSFFKDGLIPVVARGLIESYINSDAIKHIDWKTLQIKNTNFISASLHQSHCDVLYGCNTLDGASFIYFLFEGQTTSDKLLPYRLQQYKEAIIQNHVKKHKVIPIVFILCLYCGSGSYEFSSDTYELAPDPDFARNAKSEKIFVVNLKKQDAAELADQDVHGLYQIMLKQGNSREILPWIRKNPKLVSLLLKQSFSNTGLAYLLAVEKKNDPYVVLDTIIDLLPNSKKNIMNALRQLEEKSMLKGMQKGKTEGTLEIARKMLLKKLSIDEISEITGLTIKEIKKLV